jgi:xanthine dehydrogenase YagR molybdenum-binding subunit
MTEGRSLTRLDGPDKVTGRASYTADTPLDAVVHAAIVPATRPTATITALDVAEAAAAPGVIAIFTHENTPKLGPVSVPLAGQSVPPLQDDRVLYEGQPVALVVADTAERAADAARLVRVSYRAEPFQADFLAELQGAEAAPLVFGFPSDKSGGDVDAALETADVRLEATFVTSDRHHNSIELAATLAVWNDGELLVHDATQGVEADRASFAEALGIDPALVRVKNEYVGGGFGSKGWGWPYQVLAAMAARELDRPVKLVLTRAQSFTGHGHQPATRQTVRLGAKADGTITCVRHESVVAGSFVGDYVEAPGMDTPALYAWPAFSTTNRLVRLHRPGPIPMRSPYAGVGLVAVEIAMDELAYELGIDPVELRLKNYAERDPADGLPFSAKRLRECYEIGARRFGWSERPPEAHAMREGLELVGYGMATAILPGLSFPASAWVSIDRSGRVSIETSTHEIGQGARTVFAQIAAEVLGVAPGRVALALGDTALPAAPFTIASSATASVGSAVHDGAVKLRKLLAQAGGETPADYESALAELGIERLSADGEWLPDEGPPAAAVYSFGALFVEVRVDVDIPIPRVRRVVGVYNAGKILNPRTARSQMSGGIVWGIGQMLLERSDVDPRLGRFLSKNLAGYLVPVNADVPEIDVSFVEEFDEHAGPTGARGIGELAAVGIGPAIANAVFHATGIRVREVPIRVEHLLGVGSRT